MTSALFSTSDAASSLLFRRTTWKRIYQRPCLLQLLRPLLDPRLFFSHILGGMMITTRLYPLSSVEISHPPFPLCVYGRRSSPGMSRRQARAINGGSTNVGNNDSRNHNSYNHEGIPTTPQHLRSNANGGGERDGANTTDATPETNPQRWGDRRDSKRHGGSAAGDINEERVASTRVENVDEGAPSIPLGLHKMDREDLEV